MDLTLSSLPTLHVFIRKAAGIGPSPSNVPRVSA